MGDSPELVEVSAVPAGSVWVGLRFYSPRGRYPDANDSHRPRWPIRPGSSARSFCTRPDPIHRGC